MLFPCEPRYKERDDGGELTKGLDREHESCHLGLPIHVGGALLVGPAPPDPLVHVGLRPYRTPTPER